MFTALHAVCFCIMKKFSTLLIIAGIIIFMIPIAGRIYTDYRQGMMYKEYLAELEQSSSLLNDTFSEEVASDGGIETADSQKKSQAKDVLGRISIPAISSSQLLLEGSDSQHLRWGAGHVQGTAMPGETGNCSIAGHRNYTFGSYFSRLDELKTGDVINIEYGKSAFTYVVTESFVVTPDDISVLQSTDDSHIITLITCHPKGSNTQRLIVRGELSGN